MSKILRVYIDINHGTSEIIDIEVDDNIEENRAEEIAKDKFFNECNYGWEFLENKDDKRKE